MLKTFIFELKFFQGLQSALLKSETKSKKRCKSPKNCWTVDRARDRSKTLKKVEEKQKMRKSHTTAFLLLLFLYRKTYILFENIFEET